jgi:small-conductance mechanosensitive channel
LSADVIVDGEVLFRVRGVPAFPADERAARIAKTIVALAKDESVNPDDGQFVQEDDRIKISIAGQPVMQLVPEDAELEQVGLPILGEVVLRRIQETIAKYRSERTPEALTRSAIAFAGISIAALLLAFAVVRLYRWAHKLIDRRMKAQLAKLEEVSHKTIDAGQMWRWLDGALDGLRLLTVAIIGLVWAESSLGLFPWTRAFAQSLFNLLVNPVRSLAEGFMDSLPDLVFLVVLYFVIRFILRVVRLYFLRIDSGRIVLGGFEQDWALPTYRILRLLIIAFALVVAYPYIPGSGSEAFKGVSLLFGLVFSLGSTSFIANAIAGYSLTYRRAFRLGDIVRIGDILGEVTDMSVMATKVRTPKNEEVNVPNSIVVSSAVTNYSALQAGPGLILHTEVGIGFDTPWRQVEALLLMAADRTTELLKDPAPFVLHKALGDFAVTYELNAFSRDAARMPRAYSALHANIQDVFNEYGVQIMSPAYVADPDQPKVVSKEDWYSDPAKAPGTPD